MGRRIRGWRLVVMLAMLVVVTGVAAEVAFALTTGNGGTIRAVKVKTSTDLTPPATTDWTAVPGATATIETPEGQRALLVVRFTAESECSGAAGECRVRILVGPAETNPAAGTNFIWDTSDGTGVDAHAMDRSRSVGSGVHTIQVQYQVNAAGVAFILDDWSLTVERAEAT